MPAGATQFVRYADLSRLPQVTFTVRGDPNFSAPVRLSGVPLDELLHALGFHGGKQLIAAICDDGYEAHYTAEYREAHHPFLVLRIDGQEPAQWPQQAEGGNYGPYLIAQPSFSRPIRGQEDERQEDEGQEDEPQLPYGVIALRFYAEDATLAALRPKSAQQPGSPITVGYRIAFQNCLRCHRDRSIGGTKAPLNWAQVAMMAEANPAVFGRYVLRPQSVNPGANMPASPQYDAATIAALTAYFQQIGAERKP
jgi:mono/diheme cytochrome c family protein